MLWQSRGTALLQPAPDDFLYTIYRHDIAGVCCLTNFICPGTEQPLLFEKGPSFCAAFVLRCHPLHAVMRIIKLVHTARTYGPVPSRNAAMGKHRAVEKSRCQTSITGSQPSV